MKSKKTDLTHVIGTCGLCHAENVQLQDSHLLPRAFYADIIRAEHANPVIMTHKIGIQISKQISDHFLCANCECRTNRRGEAWTLSQCYRRPGQFTLQKTLLHATPISRDDHGFYYDGRGLLGNRLDELAYFAVSVFWRMSAREWHLFDHKKRLVLGDHEEALRRFLMDEAPFPNDAALCIYVSPNKRPIGWLHAPIIRQRTPFLACTFSIPGMAFMLNLGPNVQQSAKDCCIISSQVGPVYLTKYFEELAHMDFDHLARLHRVQR
jgi:hypothetical protein